MSHSHYLGPSFTVATARNTRLSPKINGPGMNYSLRKKKVGDDFGTNWDQSPATLPVVKSSNFSPLSYQFIQLAKNSVGFHRHLLWYVWDGMNRRVTAIQELSIKWEMELKEYCTVTPTLLEQSVRKAHLRPLQLLATLPPPSGHRRRLVFRSWRMGKDSGQREASQSKEGHSGQRKQHLRKPHRTQNILAMDMV